MLGKEVRYVVLNILERCRSAAELLLGHENKETPTDRAVSQHIDKLKGSVGGKSVGSGAKKGTPSKALATPRKQAMAKTPTSSAKRKRSNMSDDDLDDSEQEMTKSRLSESTGRRGSLPRKGKGKVKAYNLDSEDDEGDDEDEAKPAKPEKSENGSDIFNGMINYDGAAESKPSNAADGFANGHRATKSPFTLPDRGTSRKSNTPSKKRSKLFDSDDESDVSTFSAGFT